eukprot:m.163002 g.163002  ORF g.163002 m.163002 type:complete len:64 (-) comp17677_c0_seq5:927-1118(-)
MQHPTHTLERRLPRLVTPIDRRQSRAPVHVAAASFGLLDGPSTLHVPVWWSDVFLFSFFFCFF